MFSVRGCRALTVFAVSQAVIMPTHRHLLAAPCVTLFSCSLFSAAGANKQRMRWASSCRRPSQWFLPPWRRWWMPYGRCGASGSPSMTTSTPVQWRSASTPWRTSSPSTSLWLGCCLLACWYSSPTSSLKSSEDVWCGGLGLACGRWCNQNFGYIRNAHRSRGSRFWCSWKVR